MTMSGIATGSILVFVSSIGMFVVSDVMGGSKVALIGNVIQNQFLGARDWPFGSALSMIVVLFSVLLIYLYYRATKVYKYDGNGGIGKDEEVLVSYSWLILLFLYFPMMVLMVYSFNDSRINAEWEGFTFHWYTDLFQKQDVIDAFVNSMTIAVNDDCNDCSWCDFRNCITSL